MLSEQAGDEVDAEHHRSPLATVRTILIADPVMRLDHVLAVAVAVKAAMVLVLALTSSIPSVVFGSTRMIRQMERFSIGVTLGTTLIGGVGGEAMASDSAIASLRRSQA
jgi:predicted tellurium resistance membrane protein TerC